MQESCTAATSTLRLRHGFSEGEQVIAEASATLTLGSGRDKDLVGAGRLTLTQRAAYFLVRRTAPPHLVPAVSHGHQLPHACQC